MSEWNAEDVIMTIVLFPFGLFLFFMWCSFIYFTLQLFWDAFLKDIFAAVKKFSSRSVRELPPDTR